MRSQRAERKTAPPENRDRALRDIVEATRLNRPIHSQDEAVVLSLLYARKLMDAISLRFFAARPITEAEFNALMVLHDYRRTALKQAEIASRLLVTRLSARQVLLRLEHKGFVELGEHADRRAHGIRMSKAGEKTFLRVRDDYYAMIAERLSAMRATDKRKLIESLFELRSAIS